MTGAAAALRRELAALAGAKAVREPVAADLRDATESRALAGRADAVVAPSSTAHVEAVVRWCYEHDVAITPRGGGTGLAGGATPLGGIVLALARMAAVRALEPSRWRAHVEAGLPTAHLRRLARENGLMFPPDPGATEQSQIGGNIATNAGGPHTFKHGVTGRWITGLEAVLAPGETVRLGGAARKDVAGYDLKSLLIGSEGTLGIVTAAWVRLAPAPAASHPVLAAYPDLAAGCAALDAVLAAGIEAGAVEFLDAATMRHAAAPADGFPPAVFTVLCDAEGTDAEAERVRAELVEALGPGSCALYAPQRRAEAEALWRWRDGVSIAVDAAHGGKVSEDIAVPVERLREAIEATLAIGARHDLDACSWGHAGDGNVHSTFLLDRRDAAALERAEAASGELFALATQLGGTISGEHGLGLVKNGRLRGQWAPRAVELHRAVKREFDPKGLLNPGKKLA